MTHATHIAAYPAHAGTAARSGHAPGTRLSRTPPRARTLARLPSRPLRLPRQSQVQPRLAAELISRSILKKPEDLKT